jgi:hypothetical protein
MSLAHADIRQLEEARRNLAGLRADLYLVRCRLALKAGFNPNQPRVPAGNPDGGQWTRVDASWGRGSIRRPTGGDRSTGKAWKLVATSRRPDGTLAAQTAVNRDGTTIRSEFSATPTAAGWTDRYTVSLPSGNILTVQNLGRTQQIVDRQGRLLQETVWSARGPEPSATVQPAFLLAIPSRAEARALAELGLKLYDWLSTLNGPDQQAVISFGARGYVPNPILNLEYVGPLSIDAVRAACPRFDEVQARTDAAVDAVRSTGADLTQAAFGTAVHLDLKHQIDSLDDPSFWAEVSVLKTLSETYGRQDSIRVDVLEDIGNGTVCVYDIKTGTRGLSFARATEIAEKVFTVFPTARRIIIIETRPTP